MMPLPDSFRLALAAFGRKAGVELSLSGNRCRFTVDGSVEVEIDYVEKAHVAIAWAVVGLAPEDAFREARARALLALDALDAPNGGFTLAMDPETRLVLAHDNRPAELFDSADRLAAWIDALASLVNRVRVDFEERFPCGDPAPAPAPPRKEN